MTKSVTSILKTGLTASLVLAFIQLFIQTFYSLYPDNDDFPGTSMEMSVLMLAVIMRFVLIFSLFFFALLFWLALRNQGSK